MSNRTKIIFAVVAVVVVLVGAYFLFFNNNNQTTALGDTGGPSSAAQATFLQLANELGPITFDTAIFSDPRFAALVDIHTAILPEPTGRTDPFAPVSGITATQ